jgi:hypothetical protein
MSENVSDKKLQILHRSVFYPTHNSSYDELIFEEYGRN